MLEALEQESALEGRTILEPTSGDTGIAIAPMAMLLDRLSRRLSGRLTSPIEAS